VAAGFFSFVFPASRLRPAEREEEEEDDLERELEPEELEELDEERDPFESEEEDPELEPLFPPRFFFFSAALVSFALVRSRLLRLDAIVWIKIVFVATA